MVCDVWFLFHFCSLCVSATDPETDTVSTMDLGNRVRQYVKRCGWFVCMHALYLYACLVCRSQEVHVHVDGLVVSVVVGCERPGSGPTDYPHSSDSKFLPKKILCSDQQYSLPYTTILCKHIYLISQLYINYHKWSPPVILSKYIHVRSCFKGFIKTNLMV